MNFKEFQAIPEDEIFRVVITKYHTVTGFAPEYDNRPLKFVCKKGIGHSDWAIYCHYYGFSDQYILEQGQKVTSKADILSIFPCDEETFNHYRF